MSVVVKNISKTFKLSSKQMKINKTNNPYLVAVDNVSFTAYPGEVFGLLGPNGAGKTTTLRMISTLIKKDQGEIFINNESVDNVLSVRMNIGFLTNDIKPII